MGGDFQASPRIFSFGDDPWTRNEPQVDSRKLSSASTGNAADGNPLNLGWLSDVVKGNFGTSTLARLAIDHRGDGCQGKKDHDQSAGRQGHRQFSACHHDGQDKQASRQWIQARSGVELAKAKRFRLLRITGK